METGASTGTCAAESGGLDVGTWFERQSGRNNAPQIHVIMPLSSSAALLLAACWILPAVVVAGIYAVYSNEASTGENGPEVERSLKGIRAEIQQMDLEAPRQEWRSPDWEGPGARLRAQVQRSSYEVMLLTPYAETTVSVGRPDGDVERRRCSLCLN